MTSQPTLEPIPQPPGYPVVGNVFDIVGEENSIQAMMSGVRALDHEDVAASVIYTLRQPDHAAVNEILVEPATSLFRGSS